MRSILQIGLGLILLGVVGCSSSSIQMSREWDDPVDEEAAWEVQSPDAFVERLGEPDSWQNEGEGDHLRMTAVWNCVDGKTREVKWRQRDSGKGLRHWSVVSDTSRDGCKE